MWKGLGDQIRGMSELEDKLNEELTRVSSVKMEMSEELVKKVTTVYEVLYVDGMGSCGVVAYLDNDIAPGFSQLHKLHELVTTPGNSVTGDLF